MKFKHMFSPIQIGPMTVKNRFVVPPMGNNFAKTDGTLQQLMEEIFRKQFLQSRYMSSLKDTEMQQSAQ